MCYHIICMNFSGENIMDWLELKVKIPTDCTETAEAIAAMAVPYGFYTEDYSDVEQGAAEIAHIDLIDEELLARDRTHSVLHLYICPDEGIEDTMAYLSKRFDEAGIPHTYDTGSISDADWIDNWKKFFKVTEVGEKLVIRPSWEPFSDDGSRLVLNMDPGAAFGTGTHATTRMCMELLEKYLKKGDDMLDVGCGSGILSIAAALLGANKAVGVDIDATAVKVSRENAALNGLTDKTEYSVGDLAEAVTGKYNVICANIVADIVMRLSETVEKYMADGGYFLCSGIIDIRVDEVKRTLCRNGFDIIETRNTDNWFAIAAKRTER